MSVQQSPVIASLEIKLQLACSEVSSTSAQMASKGSFCQHSLPLWVTSKRPMMFLALPLTLLHTLTFAHSSELISSTTQMLSLLCALKSICSRYAASHIFANLCSSLKGSVMYVANHCTQLACLPRSSRTSSNYRMTALPLMPTSS